MRMNLPNKLTLLRVLLVPFFVAFLLLEPDHPDFKWDALGIFVIASITDMLDGMIARKYNLITNFGKFADPLADKMLVCSALVCLSVLGWVPVWMTLVVIIREFIISGFRLIAAEQGKVIAASWWGKWKTAVTMIAVILQLYLINANGVPGVTADPDVTTIIAGNTGFVPAIVYAHSADPVYVYACLFAYGLFWIATILTVVSLVDYMVKNKEVLR